MILNPPAVPPAETILEYLTFYIWTKEQLAEYAELSIDLVNELCDGTAMITPKIADKLGRVFDRPAQFWLNLQKLYLAKGSELTVYLARDNARFPRPIVCGWCGNHYRSLPDDPTLGDGCAACVVERKGSWFVECSYDMRVFRFVRNAPTAPALPSEPMCDVCIAERTEGTEPDLVAIELYLTL